MAAFAYPPALGWFEEMYSSVDPQMMQLRADLQGSFHPQALKAVIDLIATAHDIYDYDASTQAFARMVKNAWDIESWLEQCFARYCDTKVLSIDNKPRSSSERILFIAACVVLKLGEGQSYRELAKAVDPLLTGADFESTQWVPELFEAVDFAGREQLLDEYQVMLNVDRSRVAEVQGEQMFTERLRLAVEWSDIEHSIFAEKEWDLKHDFIGKISQQLGHRMVQDANAELPAALAALIASSTSQGDFAHLVAYLEKIGCKADNRQAAYLWQHGASVRLSRFASLANFKDDGSFGAFLTGNYHENLGRLGLLTRLHATNPESSLLAEVVRIWATDRPRAADQLRYCGLSALLELL